MDGGPKSVYDQVLEEALREAEAEQAQLQLGQREGEPSFPPVRHASITPRQRPDLEDMPALPPRELCVSWRRVGVCLWAILSAILSISPKEFCCRYRSRVFCAPCRRPTDQRITDNDKWAILLWLVCAYLIYRLNQYLNIEYIRPAETYTNWDRLAWMAGDYAKDVAKETASAQLGWSISASLIMLPVGFLMGLVGRHQPTGRVINWLIGGCGALSNLFALCRSPTDWSGFSTLDTKEKVKRVCDVVPMAMYAIGMAMGQYTLDLIHCLLCCHSTVESTVPSSARRAPDGTTAAGPVTMLGASDSLREAGAHVTRGLSAAAGTLMGLAKGSISSHLVAHSAPATPVRQTRVRPATPKSDPGVAGATRRKLRSAAAAAVLFDSEHDDQA